jgi:hypothetical protein
MRVEIVPRDANVVDGLSEADVALLARHAAYGCLGIVCRAADDRAFPFVLQTMRIKEHIAPPVMQLIYCRDVADYVTCAGAIGRFLLRRAATREAPVLPQLPTLMLVGQVDTPDVNRDALQEIDTGRAFSGLIKWSTRIDSAAQVPR